MDNENIQEALKGVVESVRQVSASRRRQNVSYSVVAKAGYEEIQKLRNDGYSYNIICEALVARGLLGEEAVPRYLATVFLREKKRRAKRNEQIMKASAPGKEAGASNHTEKAPKNKEERQEIPALRNGEQEKQQEEERLKKMTGQVIDTGTGTIRKMPNGTFDF